MNFDERKNHYSKCGMYNGYDKKNKEREACGLDNNFKACEKLFFIDKRG